MTPSLPIVLVDGEATGGVPATDSSVLRGDGCFEAVRAYGGELFRLDDHMERLERSAAALDLPRLPIEDIRRWMTQAARQGGDCIVRVVASRGSAVPGVDDPARCVVVAHPPPPATAGMSLWPVVAPWHPAGRAWELSGVKTISYAPNLAAGRVARSHGADDALLISDAGQVLEGPTFSVGWCRDGGVFVPPLELGILDSITRRVVAEVWPALKEAEIGYDELLQAEEVFVMSTVREVSPVTALGGKELAAGPVTG
ncbi:MAG: aminotransferase class IV, partial [Actinomycetota bacterium]